MPSRRADDADLIRARLRVLLAESAPVPGWLPEDDEIDDEIDDVMDDDAEDDAEDAADQDDDRPGAEDPAEQESGRPAGVGRHSTPGRASRWDPGRRGAGALWAAGLLAALLVAGWTWLDRPRVEPLPAVMAGSPGAPAAGTTSGLPATGSTAPGSTTPGSTAPATPAVGGAVDAPPTVVVSVVGRVSAPGLVTLPVGSRVADAVAAAGGLLPEADPASVNLAAVVADGEQVAVGVPGAAPGAGTPGERAGGEPGAAGAGGPLDLNRATVADLDALPGVGPVLAQRIVDHRSQHGRFTSVEQLDDVPGIGPAIFARLSPLVRV